MKLFILCGYNGSLNDPIVETTYAEAYQKMEESYHLALENVFQTNEEKEYTYLDGYSARAVIHEDWIEWSITEIDVPLAPASLFSNANERNHAQKTLIEFMPENPYLLSYFRHKGLTSGDYYIASDYLIWIDQKHDEFRSLHHLPEHIELNRAEKKTFIQFLDQDLEGQN